jgi:hypothetical protein
VLTADIFTLISVISYERVQTVEPLAGRIARISERWRKFGTRSPLSSSPRHAATPANAILNYLYTVLESETRLTNEVAHGNHT